MLMHRRGLLPRVAIPVTVWTCMIAPTARVMGEENLARSAKLTAVRSLHGIESAGVLLRSFAALR